MSNENIDNVKLSSLSNLLDIEQDRLSSYIETINSDIDGIINAIEESGFSKDDISQLFQMDLISYVNPFLFLIVELKDSIKNMEKNINYFTEYNMRKEMLTNYFGVANLINNHNNKELVFPILKEILKKFDENITEYIDMANNGKISEIAAYNKKLVNVLKFLANKEINTEHTFFVDYNAKVVNVCYMRIFLEMARVNKDANDLLKYHELKLMGDVISSKKSFFDDMEIHEKVIFDKIVEMILEDYDLNSIAIADLVDHFIYSKEEQYTEELTEKTQDDKKKKNNKKQDNNKSQDGKKITISYLNLEKMLKEKIIGQDVVINDVIQRLKIADFGVSKESGAKAVFLFAGPTGVGKTEVVKIISKNYDENNDDNLIRIDMSEYKESHTISKLLGAPPGYIGYDDRDDNTVFDKIKKKPNAIILLDEIEKAHPDILDTFLHIFDEGKAMTNKQKEVDFTNNLIFMTSNIGSFEVNKNSIGFENKGKDSLDRMRTYKKALERYLRPEFINRIDEILIFNSLKKQQIISIVLNKVHDIETRLQTEKNLNVRVELSNSALEYLISQMEFNKYGAREVRRVVEKFVLNKIINISSTTDIKNGILQVDYIDEDLNFNYEELKVLKKK